MLEEIIKNRKSTRKYQDKEIPNEILYKILKAGYLAPSWMNSQPWKFILIKKQETKDLLSEISGFQPHVKNAPALIALIADKNAWNREIFGEVLKARGMSEKGIDTVFKTPMFYPPLLGEDKVLLRTVEQVTIALSFMMLQASELGVDSCTIGAISNEATVVKKDIINKVNNILNLSDGEVLITILTLGYGIKEEKSKKTRKDFDSIVHLEGIDNKFKI